MLSIKLKEVFQIPLFSFQRGLARLEKGGIIISHRKGKTLLYQFNPGYPFLKELKSFLERAYDGFPQDIRDKYYEQMTRKRPRRIGKPLWLEEHHSKRLAGYVSEELRKRAIETILFGGACVTIYTQNRYQSYDLDYVTYEDIAKLKRHYWKWDLLRRLVIFSIQDVPGLWSLCPRQRL